MKCIKRVAFEYEWKEDDHPRDEDGKFTQSGKTRERTLDRLVDYHQSYVDRLEGRIEDIKKEIEEARIYLEKENKMLAELEKEKPNSNPRSLQKTRLERVISDAEHKINRIESNIMSHKQSLDEAKADKEMYNELGLFEMSDVNGNTHKIGNKGFKNGVSKSILGKDWQVEFRRGRIDYLKERDTGHGISKESWDRRFKGQTLINSNVTKNSNEEIIELENEIMYVWNDILTDKQREGIDILKIYYSESPQYKTRSDGSKERTLGSHGGRKIIESSGTNEDGNIMISPSVLTINLSPNDTPDEVLNTMIHEVNHSIWAKQLKENQEKIDAFTDKVIAMGKEGAITQYAGSYFDDLEEIENDYKKRIEDIEKNFKNALPDDPSKQYFLDKYAEDHKENIKNARELIANETHSEYFGMVGSPTKRDYHTVDKVKLQEVSKLIKEGLYE